VAHRAPVGHRGGAAEIVEGGGDRLIGDLVEDRRETGGEALAVGLAERDQWTPAEIRLAASACM
jgi:hypothetical protein